MSEILRPGRKIRRMLTMFKTQGPPPADATPSGDGHGNLAGGIDERVQDRHMRSRSATMHPEEQKQGPSRAERNRDALAAASPTTEIGRRAVKGASIGVIAQALRMVVQIGGTAILARIIAPEDFGFFAMAMTFTGIMGSFSHLGLSQATIQSPKIDQEMVSGLFLLNLAAALAMLGISAALTPLVVWFYDAPELTYLVVFSMSWLVFDALCGQHQALLRRSMRWIAIQRITLTAQFLATLTAIIAAWQFDAGYYALALQMVSASAFTMILAWYEVDWRPSLVRTLAPARKAINFGMGTTALGTVNHLTNITDNVLIGWYWGASDLAYYSRAFNLVQLPHGAFGYPLFTALLPALSRVQDRPAEWRALLQDSAGILAAVVSATGAIMFASSADVVRILYGPGWEPVAPLMVLLAAVLFSSALAQGSQLAYLSQGRVRRMLIWSVCGSGPVMLIAVAVSLQYGTQAVAVGVSLASLGLVIPNVYFACRECPIHWSQILRFTMPYTLSAAGTGVLILALDPWPEAAGAVGRILLSAVAIGAVQAGMLLGYAELDPAHQRMRRKGLKYARELLQKLRRSK